jgi:3'-phosphoadenosine 5'-phosphosulfate sulfotransferase (PAPS reductase)/FAD synthetase
MPSPVINNKSLRSLDEELWLQEISVLLNMNLTGLKVKCPRCSRIGVPGPKWIRGPKTKPVYVFHKNGNDTPEACLLDRTEAAEVRKQVDLSEDDIKTLIGHGRAYVLFSGGLDSLCALDYVSYLADSISKKVTALHINTTVGFLEVTEYVKEVCDQLKVDLKIVEPEIDYFTLAKRWGIPGVNSRWCCRELKIKPVTEFLASIDGPKIVFDGIRAAESGIRAKYLPVWFHPSFNCLSVSAIFKWSEQDLKTYVSKRSLPSGLSSELSTSGECWCGAYKRKEDFEKLYHLNRDIFYKLCEVEESNRNGFTFIYDKQKGQRLSLRDLEKQMRNKECGSDIR